MSESASSIVRCVRAALGSRRGHAFGSRSPRRRRGPVGRAVGREAACPAGAAVAHRVAVESQEDRGRGVGARSRGRMAGREPVASTVRNITGGRVRPAARARRHEGPARVARGRAALRRRGRCDADRSLRDRQRAPRCAARRSRRCPRPLCRVRPSTDRRAFRTAGMCAGRADERSWSRPAAPLVAVGRYRCHLEDGHAAIWWTDEHGIVAHAYTEDDDDLAALFRWWRTRRNG